MNTPNEYTYDALVVGSGMGGLTTAALLARDGLRVGVLEAAHLPGGCSSSYPRKGYVFESGATTLIGFDPHQPLARLERMLGIDLPRKPIDPPMQVHLHGHQITRFRDREEWITEAARVFGNERGQRRFWKRALSLADMVWRVSERNDFFPPLDWRDWLQLPLRNRITDLPALRYGFMSVEQVMRQCGVDTPLFRRFIDEQLMITAQSTAGQTPFLFGAPALTYTNSQNYYVPGGLLTLMRTLQSYIEEREGHFFFRTRVDGIEALAAGGYEARAGERRFRAPIMVTNLPVWNLAELTSADIRSWFETQAAPFGQAWSAFVMGIATRDTFPADMPLHHQIHLKEPLLHAGADSLFVSMSSAEDHMRAPAGERVLNVSCHTLSKEWFALNGSYEQVRDETSEAILNLLQRHLPGFDRSAVQVSFAGTPVTWQKWTGRYEGRVGGIPQSMQRSLLAWPATRTPFEGWVLTGDTVYPGQGIPGVTLGGIHAYLRLARSKSADIASRANGRQEARQTDGSQPDQRPADSYTSARQTTRPILKSQPGERLDQ